LSKPARLGESLAAPSAATANGRQAIKNISIGRTRRRGQENGGADDIQVFGPSVNPPANMKSLDWIKAGFPGAKCD
jgi:branched-chain amino acid transport system substrate-binding protein